MNIRFFPPLHTLYTLQPIIDSSSIIGEYKRDMPTFRCATSTSAITHMCPCVHVYINGLFFRFSYIILARLEHHLDSIPWIYNWFRNSSFSLRHTLACYIWVSVQFLLLLLLAILPSSPILVFFVCSLWTKTFGLVGIAIIIEHALPPAGTNNFSNQCLQVTDN